MREGRDHAQRALDADQGRDALARHPRRDGLSFDISEERPAIAAHAPGGQRDVREHPIHVREILEVIHHHVEEFLVLQ